MRTELEYRDLFRTLTLVGGLLCLALLLAMALDPGSNRDWQAYQQIFRDSLRVRAATPIDSASAEALLPEIRQASLDAGLRVDRCMSCHLGTVLPGGAGLPQPLQEHPDTHLALHPVERFGCTLCHGGDGRALTIQAPCTANAADNDRRESLRYIESSCGRCHTDVFDTLGTVKPPRLHRGRILFQTSGCLGCHRLRMVGGTLGPDLTGLGDATASHYSFRHLTGDATIPVWLREHFREPSRVSPGSVMPPVRASAEDLDALITFVLSLHSINLPADYYALEVLAESRGSRSPFRGREAYDLMCRACHGESGQGTSYKSAGIGAPAIGNATFQAIASDEFLQFTLMEGRGPRLMASWQPALSGLRPEELQRILATLRTWKAPLRTWETISRAGGSRVEGAELFSAQCAPCHGSEREGGIGPGLGDPAFLRLASDLFLYRTIATGRRNTAMPSWSHLPDRALYSLVLYLRDKTHYDPPLAVGQWSSGDTSRGEKLFGALCARCHGAHGEGGIGPAILNTDFLEAADDAFLAGTILDGRDHTPMFGWSQAGVRLSVAEVSSIIMAMRAMGQRSTQRIYPGAVLGRPQQGRELFRVLCSECHGSAGEGLKGPALNNQEFLNAASNGFLLATITLGRPGTAMPSWGQPSQDRRLLSRAERLDLVAFLRVWHTEEISRSWPRLVTDPSLSAVSPLPRGEPLAP